MKKLLSKFLLCLIALFIVVGVTGCNCNDDGGDEETENIIRISTTTSVKDSGLLAAIIPVFEATYGYKVQVTSAGTGKAINNAKAGNADLILVHAKAQEETFVGDSHLYSRIVPGFTSERLSFMYNYFVLAGPKTNNTEIKNAANVKAAFEAIATNSKTFISRGDNSGTHSAELKLWPSGLGITKEATSFASYTSWYKSAGTGMGACLAMADQQNAYILSDKATYLTYQKDHTSSNLEIIKEEDDSLKNTYTVIAINPNATWQSSADYSTVSDVAVNTQGADAFIYWLLTDSTKELIASYGTESFGASLFTIINGDTAPKTPANITIKHA